MSAVKRSWWFDFFSPDGSIGGYLSLTLRPDIGASYFEAALVGEERPLVLVVDHEAPLPRQGLELRAEGLWTDLICETARQHWTIGLEAFGVALDDPTEAWAGCRGDRTALGFDLEWEADGPGWWVPEDHWEEMPSVVHGQVLVGREVIELAGFGHHRHLEQEGLPINRAGRFDDGTHWWDENHSGSQLVTEARYPAPVLVDDVRLARALGTATAPDGRSGPAWLAWVDAP